jgi:hypothetical protein
VGEEKEAEEEQEEAEAELEEQHFSDEHATLKVDVLLGSVG